MDKRIQAFLALKKDAYYGKVFNKLEAEEVQFCIKFIQEAGDIDKNVFAHKVNRLFIGAKKRPKNHSAITDLLTCVRY